LHTPATQGLRELQSPLPAQLVLHAVASHAYGLQVVVAAAGQVPAPVHEAAATATPAVQLASRQGVAFEG
jgi:hypothetical protein